MSRQVVDALATGDNISAETEFKDAFQLRLEILLKLAVKK